MEVSRIVHVLRFIVLFNAILSAKFIWACKRDSDCSQNSNSGVELCCQGFCSYWEHCKHVCKYDQDCDSSRNQICHLHRCTEDSVTFPDGIPQTCLNDRDCSAENGGRCELSKCTQLSTSSPRHPDSLSSWVMAVLVSGSIVLAFLLGIVIYCYRKKCISSRRPSRANSSTQIAMGTRLQRIRDDGVTTPTAASELYVDINQTNSTIHQNSNGQLTHGSIGPPPAYSTLPRDVPNNENDNESPPPSYGNACVELSGSSASYAPYNRTNSGR